MRNSKWKHSSLTMFTLFIFHLNCGELSSPDPKARKKEITQKITPLLLGIRSPIDSNQPPTNSSSYDPNAKYLPSETEIQTSLELEKNLESQDLLTPGALQKTTSDFSSLNKYVVLSPTEIDAEAQAWKNGTPLPEKTLSSEELKARYEAKITQMNSYYGSALTEVPKLSTLQLNNLRSNSYIGVFAYSYLQEYFSDLPQQEKEIIEKNLNWLVNLRKAAIDEMAQRGNSK
ncbi:hypothetical protein [Leptospira santarosai]|uniref:Lipoprotein n=1 Tax=Leptospira santarosai TaxID=28183 RepID=A0AB73M2J7_9LEPT|nr:hypothetical protein [Leptospira santarosai]ONF90891.1 hypothetical protein BWD14_19140 [Leptospira santarosai]